MLPDAAHPSRPRAPLAIVCVPVTPRRVYVRDPAGASLLRGEALLLEQRMLGDSPLLLTVRFHNGVEATLPPAWVIEVPPQHFDRVVPKRLGRLLCP